MLLASTLCTRQWSQAQFKIWSSARYISVSSVVHVKHSKTTLPTTPARTRFAPSPTGYLHLGSLRTALFNYLLAKKTGGQFILRIEDTDQKRTVPGAIDRLCSDLKWAGLQWDEGPGTEACSFGPYQQSQRTALYREYAHKLLESGHAYRCFCSAERLDELARRRQELGLPTDYDRSCAGIPKEESDSKAAAGEGHVIRLLAPDVYPDVFDLVYGRIGKAKGPNAGMAVKYGEVAYEDPVLLKTDGHPTYHLANVVDDHFMEITHVVRATEWISSTPKHLALYKAFGWTPPSFAHVGLLVDEAGHKLSKRNFDTDIAHFRDMGILPSTLLNFVALLGWSHSQRSDIMSLEQLVEQFQMQFTKGNTTVTLEKLWFLQRSHAARAATTESNELEDMTRRVEAEVNNVLMNSLTAREILQRTDEAGNQLHDSGVETETIAPPVEQEATNIDRSSYVRSLLKIDAKNYSTPAEFVERNLYFFHEPTWSTAFMNLSPNISSTRKLVAAAQKLLFITEARWNAKTLNTAMKGIVTFEAQQSEDNTESGTSQEDAMQVQKDGNQKDKDVVAHEKAYNKLFHDFLRWVLLGGAEGPSSASMMALLGKDVCVDRFERAFEILDEQRTGDFPGFNSSA